MQSAAWWPPLLSFSLRRVVCDPLALSSRSSLRLCRGPAVALLAASLVLVFAVPRGLWPSRSLGLTSVLRLRRSGVPLNLEDFCFCRSCRCLHPLLVWELFFFLSVVSALSRLSRVSRVHCGVAAFFRLATLLYHLCLDARLGSGRMVTSSARCLAHWSCGARVARSAALGAARARRL